MLPCTCWHGSSSAIFFTRSLSLVISFCSFFPSFWDLTSWNNSVLSANLEISRSLLRMLNKLSPVQISAGHHFWHPFISNSNHLSLPFASYLYCSSQSMKEPSLHEFYFLLKILPICQRWKWDSLVCRSQDYLWTPFWRWILCWQPISPLAYGLFAMLGYSILPTGLYLRTLG